MVKEERIYIVTRAASDGTNFSIQESWCKILLAAGSDM